jgi:16S rRNA (cytosine967-C5)-methyltransferase
VLAIERNRRRAGELTRTARRLRAGNIRVEVADAALGRPRDPPFDRVLVDPPCSGLGTLQARADLRWCVTPSAVREMAGTQARILAAGAAALRPGGVLVYSTCTISPTENEHVITTFLDSHADFSLDDLATQLRPFAPGWPSLDSSRRSSAAGSVLTLPHRDGTAGFFIARLRRS